jgi:hypothetical protein
MYDDYEMPDRPDPRDEFEAPERDEDNACPECEEGVVMTGRMEADTGHYPYGCTNCSYSG